jgi:hypothetical protein
LGGGVCPSMKVLFVISSQGRILWFLAVLGSRFWVQRFRVPAFALRASARHAGARFQVSGVRKQMTENRY